MVQRAIPRYAPANERWKNRWEGRFWGAMILAVGAHFAVFAWWPDMHAADISYAASELEAITIPEKVEIPPPPARIARPATPIVGDATVDPDITIHETTFTANPLADLPLPPAPTRSDEDRRLTPSTFTPYEVAPTVMNSAEVARALAANYPKLLREAGVGGTVRVWFWIDETGAVVERQVVESCGYTELDEAALAVADIIEFTPAQNRDRPVPVGVTFPIRFIVN